MSLTSSTTSPLAMPKRAATSEFICTASKSEPASAAPAAASLRDVCDSKGRLPLMRRNIPGPGSTMGAIQPGTRPKPARSHTSLASAILPPSSGITGSPARDGSDTPVSAQPRSLSAARSIPNGATWAAARSSDVKSKYSPTPQAAARPAKISRPGRVSSCSTGSTALR